MDTDATPGNPWLRPGFLLSSCAIVLIVALGIYVAVADVVDHGAGPGAATAHPVPGRHVAAADTGSGSGCRLPAPGTSKVAVRPGATIWRYSNAMAYPTSPVYGPGSTSAHGFRSCFQHSAGGALFAAANSLAFDNVDLTQARAWSDYMLAQGPYRQQRLAEEYVANDPDIRLQIIGYQIMRYASSDALIDIAARASTPQETMIISCVSDLVWQDGDWRFSTDQPESVNVVRIGDVTGYSAWSVY